jgi:hypothetical protein
MTDHIYKHIELTGWSAVSSDDAIRAAIGKAADSLMHTVAYHRHRFPTPKVSVTAPAGAPIWPSDSGRRAARAANFGKISAPDFPLTAVLFAVMHSVFSAH